MGLSFFQNVCSTLVITQMMQYYEYILMITMDRFHLGISISHLGVQSIYSNTTFH